MENAVDALKIAMGIAIFILAFTMLFQTASLARYTAEILITERDDTTYYSYYANDEWPIKVGANGMVNREVTLEDIIPTIYRYSTESYGVTIIDGQKIVARFDLQTERHCSEWYRTNDSQKMSFINQINDYVLKPIGLRDNELINDIDELQELFQDIYAQKNSSLHTRTFDCTWTGNDKLIAQRIDSDLSRNRCVF